MLFLPKVLSYKAIGLEFSCALLNTCIAILYATWDGDPECMYLTFLLYDIDTIMLLIPPGFSPMSKTAIVIAGFEFDMPTSFIVQTRKLKEGGLKDIRCSISFINVKIANASVKTPERALR